MNVLNEWRFSAAGKARARALEHLAELEAARKRLQVEHEVFEAEHEDLDAEDEAERDWDRDRR